MGRKIFLDRCAAVYDRIGVEASASLIRGIEDTINAAEFASRHGLCDESWDLLKQREKVGQ